jgi:hypothetical protein
MNYIEFEDIPMTDFFPDATRYNLIRVDISSRIADPSNESYLALMHS